MAGTQFQEALRAVAARMPQVVREHETMRIAATIGGKEAARSAEAARREVLVWAQKRVGGTLPEDAWLGNDFDYLAGGRNCVGSRIQNNVSDIWAIRMDDPDKKIPGRTWTTEVVIGLLSSNAPQLSVRLLASTPEDSLDVNHHSPGFVQQVSDRCGLWSGGYQLSSTSQVIDSADDAEQLSQMLADPNRKLPVFVFSTVEGDDTEKLALDAPAMARAMLGIAHVVILPAMYTWYLTERFGKTRSVFGGAVRAYLPGFDATSDPYAHRLFLADHLMRQDGAEQSNRWMRSLAAQESVRRTKLGRDALAFAPIRNAKLELRQSDLAREGASDTEQLAAANARIAELERQARENQETLEFFSSEHEKAEIRAESAEQQLRASGYRIRQLEDQIAAAGGLSDVEIPLPESWGDFAGWCDTQLAGKLVLAPGARRMVKSPKFEDVQQAARCLVWLATVCRERRMSGGDGSLRDEPVEDGIRNAHCGGDQFDLDWQGQRYTADWHIKTGGNSHDPKRCLRIYYFWEPTSQQIVVAEMPAHRRTDAT